MVDLGELWRYRDLGIALARRDITLRYRQTALGVSWVVLQPLLGAVVLTFVFGRIAHLASNGVPYLEFAYAGQMAWATFSATLNRASVSLVVAAPMVSKVYFPRMLLPLSVAGSALIDFAVALCVQAVLIVAYGVGPNLDVLFLPVWFLLVFTLSLGVALAASALAARFRDVQFIIPMVLQLLMFMSPVGYSVATVPPGLRWTVDLNPLTGVLQAFRWSLLGGGHLAWGPVLYSAVAAFCALVIGVLTFSSLDRDVADVI